MNTFGQALILSAALLAAMLAAMEGGWRWGRRVAREGESSETGLAGVQAGIFGLLGLLLAFAFGNAQTRLETRRQRAVEEINAVGTAWLRLDMLPASEQPALRDLFRRYLDARLSVYARLSDREATARALEDSTALQVQVWRAAEKACRRTAQPVTTILLLPAVNAMLDAATPRTVALDAHTPTLVLVLLWVLAPASALLAGYSMSGRKRRSFIHVALFCLLVSVTFYTIVDLDSARFGLIRLHSEEGLLEGLRAAME